MKRLPIQWPQAAPGEKKYWRSLDELANTPEFQEFVQREFPQGASELSSPISRRSFMSLMGASIALAGMSGCRRPVENILPYTRAPEDSVIGLPTYYATSMTLGQSVIGLLVESNDGRPTKIEGNPHHPMSMGGTTVLVQAAILDLYDPDRSRKPLIGTRETDLVSIIGHLTERREKLAAQGGAGLRILSGALVSPTMLRLRDRLLSAMPQAGWHTWESVCEDEVRAGSRLAFEDDLHAHLLLENAEVILALDADLFGSHPDALRHVRTFANRRRVESPADMMNRLYAVESAWTTAGACADHRLRLRPSEIGPFAVALAGELARGGAALPSGLADALPKGKAGNVDEKFVAAVARDLRANKGRAVIAAGRGQPREVHALVHALNAALDAPGNTIQYIRQADAGRKLDRESLTDLLAAVDHGEVDTLVVLGGNPAYDTPADLKFEERVKAKKDHTTVLHLGAHLDETAELAQIHVPRSHFLEAWGDARATDGTTSIVQPLIAPLYESLSDIELVALLAEGGMTRGYELVQKTWRNVAEMEEAAGVGTAAAVTPAAPAPGQTAAATPPAPGQKAPAAATPAPAQKVPPAATPAPAQTAAATPAPPAATAPSPAGATPAPAGTTPAPAGTTPAPAGAAPAGNGVAVAAAGPSAFDLLFDRHFRKVLHDGLLHEGGAPVPPPPVRGDKVGAAFAAIKTAPAGSFEIVFPPDSKVYDGRFANNGWLQELADPITKLAWDNAAILSPRTARELGVGKDDMLQIGLRGRTLEAAVYVQPGQADNTVTLTQGYGRRRTGRVGTGAGWNANLLRDSSSLGFDVGATVRAAGRKYEDDPRDANFIDISKRGGLVTTQDHFAMEGRPLVREAPLSKFREEPDFAQHAVHHPPLKALWDERPYVGQQWGMTIDLSACVGCGACTIACQAENNIPIVGKAQVRKGREMSWIRVDRYFAGDEDNPEAIQQPVPCMQCENAPCENVCPVGATVHSQDGLNDMVYNRCIGTRYCANNCPYKVRRFNYLDWRQYSEGERPSTSQNLLDRRGDVQEVAKLKYNPDVTLRSRGVMEKCTYCVQRIRGAERDAKLHGEDRVTDGVITPACVQVCPAEAIAFGDITDPNSRVSLLKKSQRNYEMLAELDVKPRTSYLARIRNPNPELSPASVLSPEHSSHE